MIGWRENHIKKSFGDVSGRRFVRENFWECNIKCMRNTVFEHCSLAFTKLEPKRLSDLLGLTMTLDCFSFQDCELNELAFDTLIYLISTTKGNDEKRAVLKSLVTPTHQRYFKAEFDCHELTGSRT